MRLTCAKWLPPLLRACVTALVCAAIGVCASVAQPIAADGVMVYRYARPGEATVRVNVWGAVRQSGLYEVPLDMDLLGLLSVAGGPNVVEERRRERRIVVLQLSRSTGGSYDLIFEAPLNDVSAERRALPAIQNGDILTVKTVVRDRFGWRDALAITSAAGTVAVVVLNALRLRYRR